MPRLLVSVRDAREALQAVAARVDLIDVKEPARGSLGGAAPATISAVLDAVGGAVPVSAAFGEVRDLDRPLHPDPRLAYAKVGLDGCMRQTDQGAEVAWHELWRRAFSRVSPRIKTVAVAYADWAMARAPEPVAVMDFALMHGCTALLLDTADKRRGNLFAALDEISLRRLVEGARSAGLVIVLAGSLDMASLPRALDLLPDYVAVRGAVCRGDRAGRLDEHRLAEVVALVRNHSAGREATIPTTPRESSPSTSPAIMVSLSP